MDLLIGCGSSRVRRIATDRAHWEGLVTLDMDLAHRPDYLWDLNEWPLPFSQDSFDEIHAYEVIEHLGVQGDYRAFFGLFGELWRILKPGGYMVGSCPSWKSAWAWGDPGHTRVITSGTLAFLDREEYKLQVGVTAMTDYRGCYHADFSRSWVYEDENNLVFILRAVKPAREW